MLLTMYVYVFLYIYYTYNIIYVYKQAGRIGRKIFTGKYILRAHLIRSLGAKPSAGSRGRVPGGG